jgi:hypothetical protein
MRYFHDLYAVYQFSPKFGVTAGFDIGAEQKQKGSDQYNIWYTPVLIAKFNVNEKFSLTGRGEYYQDKKGVIIATGTENGFNTFGYSFNADYLMMPNLVFRAELRNLNSHDALFLNRENVLKTNSTTVALALAFSF